MSFDSGNLFRILTLAACVCGGLSIARLVADGAPAAPASEAAAKSARVQQEPPVINPGPPGGSPSDAVILFDGKDLSKWRDAKSNAAPWKVENGYMEVTR